MAAEPNADHRIVQRATLARVLAQAGLTDALVTDRESARQLLTDHHQELIQAIKEGEFRSVQAFASDLDRDPDSVRHDLNRLFENDVIEYETTGGQKIPRLKHSVVISEPIISQDEAFDDILTNG